MYIQIKLLFLSSSNFKSWPAAIVYEVFRLKMQPRRIDVAELKVQLVNKIGPERSKQYFYYLNRLLAQKLSKIEFDKLCFRLLGRENLPLHNHFIRSVLKNSCNANSSPPLRELGPAKSALVVGKSSTLVEYDQEQSGSVGPNQYPGPQVWSNGSILPISPRKGRSNIRDRKLKDRPSPLGINGKADTASHHSTTSDNGGFKTFSANGSLSPNNYLRQVHHNDRSTLKESADTPLSSHGKFGSEDVQLAKCPYISQTPLLAPLGIPLCSASTGGARKVLPVSTIGQVVNYFDSGGLFDNEKLRSRMEQIASVQGLNEVSAECSSILNSTLDVYLKRLIKSCIELSGARSGRELTNHMQGKLKSGMLPHHHVYTTSGCGSHLQEQDSYYSISLLDFKVAMELNPQQLGDDWPSLLEKICMHAFKE